MSDKLTVGLKLHAKFDDGKFYPAEIVAVSKSKRRAKAPIKISYAGYGAEADAWLPVSCLRSKLLKESSDAAYEKLKVPSRFTPRLQGKVAIVTGAGSQGAGMGIGRAISIAMAREGAKIFLVGRREEPLQETAAMIKAEGFDCDMFPGCDVAIASQVSDMVEACMTRYGKVNVLVNNVGIVCPGDVVSLELEAWSQVMSSNVFGAFNTIRQCVPHMLQSGEACSIINIGSLSGIRALRAETAYCASKGALNALTMSVAMEFISKGIRCNGVLPGLIHTPLVDSMVKGQQDVNAALDVRRKLSPTGDMGESFDIAHAVVYMASDESKYTNGADLVIDGGLHNQCQMNQAGIPMPAAMPGRLDRTSMIADAYQFSRMKGKVAIVTGAGCEAFDSEDLWGIGKTIAVVLARDGAKVWAVDLKQANAENTKAVIDKEGHGECYVHSCDVSSPEAVQAMVEACVAKFGRVDYLVNNVGIVSPKGILDTTEEHFKNVFGINATSAFLTCKYAVPHLLQADGGAIVNVSSISSIRFLRPEVAYTVSKSVVNALAMQIGMQYAKDGLRCNAVLPGLIDTPLARSMINKQPDPARALLQRRNSCPLGRGGDSFDVAYLVHYLLSDEARYTNGQLISVDAGITSRIVI